MNIFQKLRIRSSSVVGLLICILVSTPFACGQGNAEASKGERLFALVVKPLFAEKCMACHGADPDAIEGGLDMRNRRSILVGGDSFESKVLIEGDGESSVLYRCVNRSIADYEMPPKEADGLSQSQQWAIRDWIDAGAPWPSEQRIEWIQKRHGEGVRVLTSKALSDDWQDRRYESKKLWAYRPLEVVTVPDDRHPIDFFIDRRLDDRGLSPAGDADPIELVRRISFGLTGLPPEQDAVDRFLNSFAQDAERAVIEFAEERMSSSQYGEHFGLHWLDTTRYADTGGFANDYSRPNAWRYRDYVVRSFNRDKPYNEFVREQIAGDEMDLLNPENLIAVGFLRMGPWEQTSMSVFKETRQQWLDDVTDSVGQTFFAHAMQCAKCHDHKFDPVPTRDYYGMMAAFSTTQFAERNTEFLESENTSDFEQTQQLTKAKIDAYRKQHQALRAKVEKIKKDESGEAKVGDNGLDPGDEASLARINKNMARHRIELDRVKPLALSVYTGKTIHRNQVNGRIAMPDNPWDKGRIQEDTILAGGSAYSPSDPVKPGALSAARSLGGMPDIEFPSGRGKRRLALADWIVDKRNPLTARVMVNRVWYWHFGKGIAGNPNNFGGTGKLPTHPQLLDYLAHWFTQNGWSVKKLNRLIVSSQVYRRSSRHPDAERISQLDPQGLSYAAFAPRRLTAEEFRDAMLFVSGELNGSVGGIPCRPDINREVAFQPRQIMGGTASVYEPDPLPQQRNRRTLYAEKIRGLRDPFMETFNQPGPDRSCELRETSTIAPQALTLLNSNEIYERSIALAVLLLRQSNSDKMVIDDLFIRLFSRSASKVELATCLNFWKTAAKTESAKRLSNAIFPDTITRTVMAEKTGKPYSFEEIMPAYQDYQPDMQPADVDSRTRGLAQLVLVLFNSNEFGYLD